ncbi:MAG: hypothetical protein ACLVD1_08005 [Lacrimispora saccharolytica]
MAKTIKFNLILDDYPVRNLEGLQNHFSIEDMLKYFDNGLLLRWLKVRGYTDQYNQVNEIDRDSDKKNIVQKLVKIFQVETDNQMIEECVGILDYLERERELDSIYEKLSFERKRIIDDYHEGYNILIHHMEENQENMAALKADAAELEKNYLELFRLDYSELYFRLRKSAPKAIFAILTHDAFRELWMNKKDIYQSIKDGLLPETSAKSILEDDLKIVQRDTQAMWDQIEKPEKKIMVISVATGSFIKNAGVFSEKISASEANGKLLILNGLEYQCNNSNLKLLYMEV